MGALSSDGSRFYTLRLVDGVYRCNCPGFEAREYCYHSTAAAQRFAPARTCAWCGYDGADVEAYVNGSDGDALLPLCRPCLTTAQAPASWWALLRPVAGAVS